MPAAALNLVRSWWLILTLACLFVAPARAEDAGSVHLLLEQSRHWEDARRDDLARQSLDKLLLLSPAHPEALARLGQLQLRAGNRAGAERAWQQLQARWPGSASTASLALALRASGPGQVLLQQARALARQGNVGQALTRWQHLLSGTQPDGELAVEYWQTVARSAQGWPRARAGLQALLQREPGRSLYVLALAELWLPHPPLPPELLTQLGELTGQPALRQHARSIWRQALLQAAPGPVRQAGLRQYLAQFPQDAALDEQLARETTALAQAAARLRDPAWRALQGVQPALARNDLADAERALNAARSYQQDPRWLSDAFELRLRQNRFDDAARLVRQGLAREPGQAGAWRARAVALRAAVARQQASEALDAHDAAAALNAARRARQLAPQDQAAMRLLARAQQLNGQGEAARATLRTALLRQPEPATLADWQTLWREHAGPDAALTELAALPGSVRRILAAELPHAQAAMLRERARLARANQHPAAALDDLHRAVTLTPDDPWLRFELAGLLGEQGQPDAAEATLRELLTRPQASADARFAMALFQARSQQDLPALLLLEHIPASERTPGMTALQQRLWLRETLRRASDDLVSGQRASAYTRTQAASQALGGRAEHAATLADGWRQLGEPARALAEFDRLPDTPAIRLARAQQLLNLSQLAEAQAQWASVAMPSDELREVWRSLARQLAEAQARAEPHTDSARAHWHTALEYNATPADAARAWRELARLSLAADAPARAVEEAQRALALQPDNADAALTLADAWLAGGQRDAARQLLTQQAARSTDLAARMAVLERQLQLGDTDALAAVWDSLPPAQRQHPAAARLGARLAEQRQRPDQARDILRQAVDASSPRLAQPASLLTAPAEHASVLTARAAAPASLPLLTELPDDPLAGLRQSLAELDYAQQPEATFSIYHTARSATPGLSSLRRDEGQFTLRGALGGGWLGELALTPTRLDAGVLNDAADGADFAARLLCGAGCAATPHQRADGLGWQLNLSRPDLSAQLGHTPHGFVASTWLGRLNSSGRWGQWGHDWELSRQPLTGSLLSYAGTRDPYSGQSWGGVTANGLALNLSHDQGGVLGVWAQLGWHKLLGKNVMDNTRATVMGGVYWRLVDTPWRQVRLGLNTLNWRFAENLSGLTFGHGGYYSPQRYHSLSLPLTWAERGPRWSWWLRGAVSLSRSQENAMPYYPTRPDWQAAAQAQPGSKPFYQGGSGRGQGYSLAAAAEYQLDAHWVLGGRLEAEKSDFYQPRRALLYLRYTPQGRPTVLPLPVEGVTHP